MRQISEMSTRTAFLNRLDVLKLGIAGSIPAVGGATATRPIAQLLTLPIRPDVADLTRD